MIYSSGMWLAGGWGEGVMQFWPMRSKGSLLVVVVAEVVLGVGGWDSS